MWLCSFWLIKLGLIFLPCIFCPFTSELSSQWNKARKRNIRYMDMERGESKFRVPLARGLRNVGSPASLWYIREGGGWESLLNTSPYYLLNFGFCGCDLKLKKAWQHIYITWGFKLLFSFKFKVKSQHHLLGGLISAFSSFC